MEAVIDTNILVSGLLRAESPTGEIIDSIFGNVIAPVFDDRILFEYRDVLARLKFSFPAPAVEDLLSAITSIGRPVIAVHTHIRLPDEKDRCFYECALSAESAILITGATSRSRRPPTKSGDFCAVENRRHFPQRVCHGIRVCSPAEFLAML
jgi:uncharacterized protein